jgi:hypothetical protein
MRSLLLTVLAVLALVVAIPTGALGKSGVRAMLSVPLPVDAPPGRQITLTWTLGYRDEQGKWRPGFDACGVFVRLLSASRGTATTAFDSGGACRAHPGGTYTAIVRVPDGGIGGIKIGLRGTTDVFFPLEDGASKAAVAPAAPSARRESEAWSPSAISLAVTLASLLALTGVAATLHRGRPRTTGYSTGA